MNDNYQGLHNLVAPIGARKNRKRLGRGEASGHGKTSGRGHKGQKARKSGGVRPGFEGGQVRLARRQPKRGFTNYWFRETFEVINVGRLDDMFAPGSVIDLSAFVAAGVAKNLRSKVKVLGTGDVSHALTLHVHAISAGARAKVEAAGGSVSIIEAKSST